MNIKIFVFDYLTHETIVDSSIEVMSDDMDIVEQNYKVFRGAFPNCQVNFVVDSQNFFFGPPLNMERDEDELSYNDYIQQEQDRKYNEEDLREAFKQSRQAKIFEKNMPPVYESFEEWFETIK
jgi:hypothetical protein